MADVLHIYDLLVNVHIACRHIKRFSTLIVAGQLPYYIRLQPELTKFFPFSQMIFLVCLQLELWVG